MRKLGIYICFVLYCFVLAGCKATVNSTEAPAINSTNTPAINPTNTPAINPTNTPAITPTNIPTISPTLEPTIPPINTPTVTPAFIDETGEETLDDLSAFVPLQDCFLDYDFKVEQIDEEDTEFSYKVDGSYDLNGDGMEDSISIQLKDSNNLSYIEVNQLMLSFGVDNPYDGEVHIIDLDHNDAFLEVACFDDGPSGDPVYKIFRYDGSNLYELVDIDAYATVDGEGKLISYFHQNNYFRPKFCSAWYEIINNGIVMKNNNIDQYLGQMYDFAGGEAYFLPYEELPDHPDIRWEEMKYFEACKVELIDIFGLSENDRILNFYFIELPTGETGLMYFWIGD